MEGEGTSKSAEVTMKAQGTSDYAEKLHDFWVRIAGYFNKDTGEFSLYKPSSDRKIILRYCQNRTFFRIKFNIKDGNWLFSEELRYNKIETICYML